MKLTTEQLRDMGYVVRDGVAVRVEAALREFGEKVVNPGMEAANDSLRKFGAALVNQNPQPAASPASEKCSGGPAIRIPARNGPNRTERRCADEYLPRHWPGLRYAFASIKFVLPSGTVYTPDWTVWDGDRLVAAVEVKGAHVHNARSGQAFKEALVAFPAHTWAFAQWKRNLWLDTIVRPS